jgi:hypothetical protein
LQLCHVEFEERGFSGFNPLASPGYLVLDTSALSDLVALLSGVAGAMDPGPDRQPQTFVELGYPELARYRYQMVWLPDERQAFYRQAYDPLPEGASGPAATILTFGTPQSPPRLFFRIAHFALRSLADPSFNPVDRAIALAHLDARGTQDLGALLDAQGAVHLRE